MAYLAVPFTFSGVSRRGIGLPMSRYSAFGFRSVLSTAGSGEGTLPDAAISP